MSQPTSFVSQGDHLVCKLHKANYGHKQALKVWFSKLCTTLHHIGF